ncbi:coiled-coil-helix-coiled-coil-helix domain-containing protein 1 [Amblyraja radiata]|uniref:coiled-coil-helix-coiled-coil-helix domain-containing protein 1 n=1 Tax=Amblyraja radiata TaxID=386614 RepID=UPI001402D7AB|nr:coiled-coil-helix-coiled-coil-helix domain-containing protein 1 [Amblyraja radiata]
MAGGGNALRARLGLGPGLASGRPVLRPSRPLVLADRVANRRRRLGEATCITEMTVMMSCWKQNNFNEAACSEEIRAFYTCADKAEAERKAKASADGVTQTGFLTPKQATKLLQRYPNKTHVT